MITRFLIAATGTRRGLLFGVLMFSVCLFNAASGQTETSSNAVLELRLISGERIKGKQVTWRDSQVEVNVYNDVGLYKRRIFMYSDIKEVRVNKNQARAGGQGAVIGSLAGGIGTVAVITAVNGQSDAWDATPMFGLMGGCCIGGLAGYGVGNSLAGKKRFDVSGNHAVFRQAAEWWKNRYGS